MPSSGDHDLNPPPKHTLPPGRALVVGGTRILAPAVQRLSRHGWQVDVVTRNRGWSPRPGTAATAVVTDATDASRWGGALTSSAPSSGWDLAIAYMPFAPASSWTVVADHVRGPLVAVLTSRVANPVSDGSGLPHLGGPASIRVLLLGWHREDDVSSWHSPEQISRAAVNVALGEPPTASVATRGPLFEAVPDVPGTVLGHIRPWSDRPPS